MGDYAYVVHPVLPGDRKSAPRTPDQELAEIVSLTAAINLTVIGSETVKLHDINPAQLLGKGTTQRLSEYFSSLKPNVVIVNHALSPVQQRNLEKVLNTKVIDRTGLILEIFGDRAQTKEGRIQVEVAALEYQKSRLVRSWTHLERQRGGAGFMGGPGETQIEIDRRIIADKLVQLKRELDKVRQTRELGRKARERVPFPIVALIGYTNAGKSTLFNTLTHAAVRAEDLLFATLDPTMRKVTLPGGQAVILADTVGFISDLPTALIAAFRSTLEQVEYADVILHVRDIARADTEAQKKDVIAVLHDMGIEYESDVRIIEVWNKLDAAGDEQAQAALLARAGRLDSVVALSALKQQGLETLLKAIADILARDKLSCRYSIPYKDGEALSWLYQHGEVLEREDKEEDIILHVRLSRENADRFESRFHIYPLT